LLIFFRRRFFDALRTFFVPRVFFNSLSPAIVASSFFNALLEELATFPMPSARPLLVVPAWPSRREGSLHG
jgi:hypothetical protein